MLAKAKVAKMLVTLFIVSLLAIGLSACKSSQYGCPNAITKAEQNDQVRS